jgi:Tol biopolymer transport system component/DNA-binding winged helix-turn-helix (wHTH) protein
MKNPTDLYEFGAFVLNERRRELLHDSKPVSLLPKDFDALLLLVKDAGEIIDKNSFRQAVWQGNHVTENSLSQSIRRIRQALEDAISDPHYIETVPKRGYRFIAPVSRSQVQIHSAADQTDSFPNEQGEMGARVSKPRRRPRVVMFVLLLLLLTVVISFVGYTTRNHRAGTPAFLPMKVTRLTTGGAWGPVISPDGKFIAHVANDANRQDSIGLRDTSSGNSIQLVAGHGGAVGPVAFSHDGSYLYFVRTEPDEQSVYFQSDIYRIPVIGGSPQKVLSNAGGVSPSPDDKQLFFYRANPATQETKLLVTDANGMGERVVYKRKWPEIAWSPSWSPDGKLLSYSVRNRDGDHFYNSVAAVPVDGGAEWLLTSARWRDVWGPTWLSDGSGFLVTGRERLGDPVQIYYVAYPSGDVRKLTDDDNSYRPISITADSKTIVSDVEVLTSNLWVVPGGDTSRARQITYGGSDGIGGVAWAPDGRIVFAVFSSDRDFTRDGAIWIVDADGQNRKRLTYDDKMNANPVVTPEGRYIAFSSYRAGVWGIWRMNLDGSDQKQLASSNDPMTDPYYSSSGRYVVFKRGPLQASTLWKVSIDGGDVTKLTDRNAYPPSVSPDGKLVAFFATKDNANELVLLSSADGAPVKTLAVSPNTRFLLFTMITRWTNGLLTYIDNKREVANIYGLPIRGGPTRQLTDFNTDTIFSFDWSPDGKHLVAARGQFGHQIVMLSGLR